MGFKKKISVGNSLCNEQNSNKRLENNARGQITVFEEYRDLLSVEEMCEMLCIGKKLGISIAGVWKIHCFRHNRIWKITAPSSGVCCDRVILNSDNFNAHKRMTLMGIIYFEKKKK